MQLRVFIANQEIPTHQINKVAVSERGTDYPYATETQPSTVQIQLTNTEGDFAKENTNNFFVRNSQNADGFKCPLKVQADTKILFEGKITKVFQRPDTALVSIDASDVIETLRTEHLTDFGLAKAWKLIQDTEASAINGVYPLTLGITPISEGSATVSKALNQTLTIVPDIKDVGVLDADNVEITDDALLSEGGPINAAAGSAYPQISAKTPYRYAPVNQLVTALLDALNIATGNRHLEFPPIQTDLHLESLGRPGYETVVGKQGS